MAQQRVARPAGGDGAERLNAIPRVACRAVFLDAGGTIVLPHRALVAAGLARAGIHITPEAVPGAHYAAVRRLHAAARSAGYFEALCAALRVAPVDTPAAVAALECLADRAHSGEILWSEPTPQARATIDALTRAGARVLIVSNSDGHAAENLRDAGICAVTPGAGSVVADVVDSTVVGVAKPDPAIFEIALRRAGVEPDDVVHVGDMVSTDIAGARAAGIEPIHLDPHRSCRARDHRHVRSLAGIWRHVAPRGRATPARPDRII